MQIKGNSLGDGVGLSVADIESPAHISDRLLSFHSSEGYDLTYPVFSVFSRNIVYYLLPPLIAEVYIYIRHAYSFRIQKSFEDEVISYRVYISYLKAVCYYGTGG